MPARRRLEGGREGSDARYRLVFASDVLERDGLGLELYGPSGAGIAQRVVAAVTYGFGLIFDVTMM